MAKVLLTDKFVKAIPPMEKTAAYTDTKTRGLTLLVTPGGAKTFYLTRKFDGKVERPKLGRYPDTKLAAARRKAGQLNALFDAGTNPEEEKRRKRTELTLDAFFEVYYRDHCQLHNKDPKVTRYTYEQYVKPALGKKKLSMIRREDVKRMHMDLGRSGRLRTANKAQGCVRAILNKAIAWEYLRGGNPAQHIERFREQARDRFLSKAELERFHEALGEEGELIRDIFLLLLYTGARKSEVLRMQWSEVDLDSEVWRIPEPKNHEPRRVVLAGPALVILKRRDLEASPGVPWVFPGGAPGKPVQELKRPWDRILNRAGIDDLRIHDLRRTHASWMLAGGADLPTIAKALGHRDFHSTLVYARLDLDPVRKAVERTVQNLAPKLKLVSDEKNKRR
jgi:integrase